MKEEGVKAEVYGRPKHIYSIWRKMQKKHLAFDELFDVRAVRIVADLFNWLKRSGKARLSRWSITLEKTASR
jgi:hypothetical protein